MLGSPVPASATLHTSTSSATPTSPTRPSRLRGLSYLRSYTHHHLHSNPRSEAPVLTGSIASSAVESPPNEQTRARDIERSAETPSIQSGENGWLPTVQGRSGLRRESLNPTSTSTEAAAPEPSSRVGMTRSRPASMLGPTPATSLPSARRRSAVESSLGSDPFAMPEAAGNAAAGKDQQLPTIRFIPHLETRSSRPSLHFTTMSRTLKTSNSVVRVGRYSERDNIHPDPNVLPIGFKSKVVSRRHCEFWCTNGQWYVKDVRSSSGTFLNHVRLSSPGIESRPFPVNDGDVVQLGIDFKGGEEVIFRCVKIRIECNRGWQKSLNSYNTTAHKRLLKNALSKKNRDSDAQSVNSSECSICLNPVAPCQALFVAPCSHVWHYKCVRDLIHGPSWPNFLCPNCRFVADLDADVEPPEDLEQEGDLSIEEAAEDEPERTQDNSEDDANRGQMLDDGNDELHFVDEPPRLRDLDWNANITDEELAGLLSTTSLRSSSRHPSSNALAFAPTRLPESSSSLSRPVTIVAPSTPRRTSSDLQNARSATPPSIAQFALAAGVINAEGPVTPRNDAGPFVLDGSAGREGVDGSAGDAVVEDSEHSALAQ